MMNWNSQDERDCSDFTTLKGDLRSIKLRKADLEFDIVCSSSREAKPHVLEGFAVCPSDASHTYRERLYNWVGRKCDVSNSEALNDFAKTYLVLEKTFPVMFRPEARVYAELSTVHESMFKRSLVSIEPQEEIYVLIYEKQDEFYVFENVHSLLERAEVLRLKVTSIPIDFDLLLQDSVEVLPVVLEEKTVTFRILQDDFMLVKVENSTSLINDEINCAICLQEINKTNSVADSSNVVLSCAHWYHRECISEWFKKKQTCPLCVRSSRIFEAIL